MSFLFFIIVLTTISARAQDIFQLLPILMNEYDLDRFSINDLKQSDRQTKLTFTTNDYYRQRQDWRNVVKLGGSTDRVSQRIILSTTKFNYGLQINLCSALTDFNNQADNAAISGHYRRNTRSASIMVALTDQRALWGAKLRINSGTNSAPLIVNNYPASQNPEMNNFFLDYLEPAFGRQLELSGRSSSLQPQLFTCLPLHGQLKLNLNLRISSLSFSPQLAYQNNSNISALTGHRIVKLSSRMNENVFEIGLDNPRWSIQPVIVIFKGSLDCNINNPLPGSVLTGLPELGWVEGKRQGFAFNIKGLRDNLFYQVGGGYSRLSMETDITTPVLGREILIPVAHRITTDLSGSALSEQIKISYNWKKSTWDLRLITGYSHSFYNLHVDGDAILLFGLTSVPVDYPLQYRLHLITLQSQLEKQFGQLKLHYEFSQYLPWLIRVDDSPLKFKPEIEKPDYKVRGGGQHRLSIFFRF